MELVVPNIASRLTGATLVDDLLFDLSQWITEVSGHKSARVYLLDRDKQELVCRLADAPRDVRLARGQGLHGLALSSKQVQRGQSAETGEAIVIVPVLAPTPHSAPENRADVIALLEIAVGYESTTSDDAAVGLARIANNVARVLAHTKLDDSRQAPQRITGVIGSSTSMLHLYANIEHCAETRTPALLTGACGVGKRLIGTAIHSLGARRTAELVEVQCDLEQAFVELELFGAGDTSAPDQLPGAVERASGGTLLVKQIDLLPLAAQRRLLEQARRFDSRIVATVLSIEAANGEKPRQEYRLVPELLERVVAVPSLAERGPDDVEMLARHAVRKWGSRLGRPHVCLDSAAIGVLRSQPWPGNVQELELCAQRAVLACDGHTIEPRHLRLAGDVSCEADSIPSGLLLADAEERYILRTLAENSQNRTRTASSLGIGRNTLVRKIKQYQNK